MKLIFTKLAQKLSRTACLAAALLCFALPQPAFADDTDDEGGRLVTPVAAASSTATDKTDETDVTDETDTEPADERLTGTNIVDNTATFTLNSKQAIIHGTPTTIDAAPFATNNTTMLPLRFIAQDILGAAVNWDNTTGLVRISGNTAAITVDLTTGKVYYNGQPYAMPVSPMVVENRTLVPLRLITELMNCQVDYIAASQSIVITLPQPLVVEAPVAAITYLPATAGQTIEYLDASYDPAGYEITEREWQVTDADGVTKTGSSLYWLFYQRQGGDYHITYRVKNAYDIWSEPTEADYTLAENLPPQITELTAPEQHVDIGQSLNITWDYSNEDWEAITTVSFDYHWKDSRGNIISKRGLPAAFFTPGEHTVTLKIMDAFGQWSDEATLTFNVSDTVQATEAEYRFNNLQPGEIYLNIANFNFNSLSIAQTGSVTTDNVTLIDSNSPERVTAPALLYQDNVSGRAAIHYHHLNNSDQPLKFYIIAHNQTDAPITLTLGKSGFAGPSADPMQVGYMENQSYLTAADSGQQLTLAPGAITLLNSSQTAAVGVGSLQSALVDIVADGNVTIAVVAMDPTADYRNYRQLAPAAAVAPQTRGTYSNAAYNINIKLGDKAEKVMIGYPDSFSDHFDDYLITGVDKLTGDVSSNKGNYGVIQQINLTAACDTGILLNPRGSIYRGAILWNGELCLVSSTGQIKTTQEGVIAGVIKAGETATITYITPDGSDSPILIVSLPAEQWNEF